MIRFRSIPYLLLAFAGTVLLWTSCKKDEPLPHNPYDDVDHGQDTTETNPPDPNSISGIWQNILQVKCNNPGCHDGTFEPDFRSAQSAWRTLVYSPVFKNDSAGSYTYRVAPGNTAKSMLIRRLTVDGAQLQRMPATGQYLTDAELQRVMNWINAGAPDILGNLPALPNLEPVLTSPYYVALDSAYRVLSADTQRVGDVIYNPFEVKPNSTVLLAFFVSDDSTPVNMMQYNRVKFSYDPDGFASPPFSANAVYVNLPGFQVWLATVNTATFGSDTTVYFRYYFNDGDHAANTEFPRDDHPSYYKGYSSMYIKP